VLIAGLLFGAIGLLLPWVTAFIASASGLDTGDGKLYGAVLLGTVLFMFLRIQLRSTVFGVLLLLACLAMASIAIYDTAHIAATPSGPFGIRANAGSGLYIDAIAGVIASVVSILELRRPAAIS